MTEIHQLQFSSYSCSFCTFSEKFLFHYSGTLLCFIYFLFLLYLNIPIRPAWNFWYDMVGKDAEVHAVHLAVPLDSESSPALHLFIEITGSIHICSPLLVKKCIYCISKDPSLSHSFSQQNCKESGF